MQETLVRSLGQEDPLEKEMAIRFSTLGWKIPGTEEPGRLQPTRSQSRFNKRGSSLVAQWLRLSMQGDMGLIPGQGSSHIPGT